MRSPETRNPLKRLYNWVISWAEHPGGAIMLFIISVAESSVFPIPPDVLLIAMGLGKPKKAFWYAAITAVGSVLGGICGYLIGFGAWGITKNFFFTYIPGFTPPVFEKVALLYNENAFLAVFGAAFTPIPYKVFTIAAGVCQINFIVFLVASIIGRSMRFMAVAGVIFFVGQKAKELLEKYFNWFAFVFFVLLVTGFLVIKTLAH